LIVGRIERFSLFFFAFLLSVSDKKRCSLENKISCLSKSVVYANDSFHVICCFCISCAKMITGLLFFLSFFLPFFSFLAASASYSLSSCLLFSALIIINMIVIIIIDDDATVDDDDGNTDNNGNG
jgi:hypothetical protein